MNYIKTMLAVAAFALAIGNAQAHLGWTLQDCVDHWGQYRTATTNDGDPIYLFTDAVSGMSIGCIFYSDHVESINYIGNAVKAQAGAILSKNGGNWQLYDDGRGKATLSTWRQLDTWGRLAQYAVLTQVPGGYKLQISTAGYGAWLDSRQQPVLNHNLQNL
jgi:hypothetical protein